eukprot:scaffold49467_cov85-Phaeocystis_antarctica.AAC.1
MLVERCSTKPSAWMVEGGTTACLPMPQRGCRAALGGPRGCSSLRWIPEGRAQAGGRLEP